MRTTVYDAIVILALVSGLLLLPFAPTAAAQSNTIEGVPRDTYRDAVDQMMSVDIEVFVGFSEVGLYPFLDWSNDGCSKSPDALSAIDALSSPALLPTLAVAGYDFTKPCQRHDFCYRNNGNKRLNRDRQAQCDLQLYRDAKKTCGSLNYVCRAAAETYYEGVRIFDQYPYPEQKTPDFSGPVSFEYVTNPIPCDGVSHILGRFTGFGGEPIDLVVIAGDARVTPTAPSPTIPWTCVPGGNGGFGRFRGTGRSSGRTVEVEVRYSD